MLKNTFAILIITFFSIQSFSQAIVPDTNSAVCAGTTLTFSVTIPNVGNPVINGINGIARTITGANGTVLNTLPVTILSQADHITFPTTSTMNFTFTARFADDNTPQSFNIEVFAAGVSVNHPFTYFKVESFHPAFNDPSQPLIANPARTVDLCQTGAVAISFDNVLFASNNPIQKATYGTITQYEYLMPAGWSLGGVTSNGSTWIPGSNTVSITPDQTTGDGQSISVRAINPCGGSLTKGPVRQVLISRPRPALSITSSDGSPVLCSGSKTFTMNGMLPGATIQWTLLGPASVAITGSSTSPSVVVAKQSTDGSAILRAVVTDCVGSRTIDQSVKAGPPSALSIGILQNLFNIFVCDISDVEILPGGGGPTAFNGSLQVADDGRATSFAWNNSGTDNAISLSDLGGGAVQVHAKLSNIFRNLHVVASNTCGSATRLYGFSTGVCPSFAPPTDTEAEKAFIKGAKELTIFPNPAQDEIRINLPEGAEAGRTTIRIIDLYGRTIRQIRPDAKISQISLAGLRPGTYFVEAQLGKQGVITQKLLKK